MQGRPTREDIAAAFFLEYPALRDAVYLEWPDASVLDTDQIIGALAANLHRYRRPPGDGFRLWAQAWVRRQTRRFRFLVQMKTEFRRLIYAAATRAMYECIAQDDAVEVTDSEHALYEYLWEFPRKLDELMLPGTAKTSSRIYKKAATRERGRRKLITENHTTMRHRVNGTKREKRKKKVVEAPPEALSTL